MRFSIVTPSFKQLDWLRLCVASVRDQVSAGGGVLNDGFSILNYREQSKIQNPKLIIPPLTVEHIIQDAGTPGIEDFAREVGAEFFRDGELQFAAVTSDGWRATRNASPIPNSKFQIPNYTLSIHCESDRGMYDAVNRGFERATGDLIAYLNCDEQYLPGALRSVAERFAEDKELEMLFADAVVVDGDGKFICFRKAQVPFRDQLWFRMPILSCATFARRSTFSNKKIALDETKKVLGDVIWIMRAQEAGLKMGVLRRFTSAFTETEQNLGVGGTADAEFLDLRARMPAHVRRFLPLYEVYHKVRSLLAGTRSHPPFSYDLFLRGQGDLREHFDAPNPTAVWRGRTGIDKAVVAGEEGE